MSARIEMLNMVRDYSITLAVGSYAISASLILNNMFHFLENHNWVIGASLGVATYFTNLYFKIKNNGKKDPDDD